MNFMNIYKRGIQLYKYLIN